MVVLTEAIILEKAKSSSLQKVRRLNLWACNLTDISILTKLPNLTVACLSANQIASLADLASCYNLEELYLRRNSINSLMELTHLKSLPRLRVLWLEGSPCTAIPDYRLTVLHLLPQLRRLDNVVVDDSEVEQAAHLVIDQACVSDRTDQKPADVRPEACDLSADNSFGAVSPSSSSSAASVLAADASVTEGQESVIKASVDIGTDNDASPWQGAKVLQHEQCASPTAMAVRSHTSIDNILQAVLFLLSELDRDELKTVSKAVHNRLNRI